MIPHNQWVNRREYEASVGRVLRSRHVGQGPEVEAFERELAERFRPEGECAVVSSGTAALYLALSMSGKCPGLSVPTYACAAVINAARLDSRPIAAYDVDPHTFNAIGPCSVYVHTYGVPGAVPDGAVEDFTHAPGASVDGVPCGSLGALSVISFGATKPLGIGAGGAVLGPAAAIAEIRDSRDYDTSKSTTAFNFQLGDVYAAIGRERLRRLNEENEWRRRTAGRYAVARLDTSADIQGAGEWDRVWYRYVIQVHDWRQAQEYFWSRGISTINPLTPDEMLHNRFGLHGEFPNAEAIAATTLSLPIWPGMSDGQVDRVADALAGLP